MVRSMGNWIKGAWAAFQESSGRYYPVIGLAIAALLERLDWLYQLYLEHFAAAVAVPEQTGGLMIFGFPSWIVAVAFAGWWFFFFALNRVIWLNRQIKDGRVKIADLRHKGVQIRNRGRWIVQDEKSWLKWKKEALEWNRKVKREMEKISEADAEWFAILDVVPPPRLFPKLLLQDEKLQQDFLKLYQEHDFRLARLGEMIRDLWGKK